LIIHCNETELYIDKEVDRRGQNHASIQSLKPVRLQYKYYM